MSSAKKKVPVPEILEINIFRKNLYFTIFFGMILMKSGLGDICKGISEFPNKCFINPKTVEKYRSTSQASSKDPYVFEEMIPPPFFIKSHNMTFAFYGKEVNIEIIPNKEMKVEKIAFRCDKEYED